MGGFFGAVSKRDVVLDVFFGTDYHSHLGTRNAGMAIWSREHGCQRQIHSIANTPFRTKFEKDLVEFHGGGCCGIGCISDSVANLGGWMGRVGGIINSLGLPILQKSSGRLPSPICGLIMH